MRLGLGLVTAMWLASCVHDGLKLQREACSREGADPEACLAVARERLSANDHDAALDFLERQIAAFQADPSCLEHRSAEACFHGVVAVLREPAVGLLAAYAIDPELLKLLGPWTGRDADGPHAQARTALVAMCARSRDPIARQRACLVLGDLALLERTKQAAGYDDVPDGYTAACKLARPGDAAFEHVVAETYHVPAADPVCAVATSARRGASIFDAPAIITRITHEAVQHEASAADAAKREAARVAVVKQREAEAAAHAAREVAATSNRQIVSASGAEDWDLLLETLRTRAGLGSIDEPAAAALAKAWDAFTTWLISGSSLVGAQLELGRDLRDAIPPGHALVQAQLALRERAIAEAKRLAKKAGGPGGRFLHAALIAEVAGTDAAATAAARAAFAELQTAVRHTLVLDKLTPSCAPLARSPAPLGQPVHVTASLVCSLEPEHEWKVQESYVVNGTPTPTDVEHRGYKLIVHGTVTSSSQTITIDVDNVVDELTDKLDQPYAPALAALVGSLWNQVIAPLDATTAADALSAGQRAFEQNNIKRAENELVIHALLAGTSSEELDKLLAPAHVTFSQLVPAP